MRAGGAECDVAEEAAVAEGQPCRETECDPADVGSRSSENTKDCVRADKEGQVMHLHKWGKWENGTLIDVYNYEANGKPDGQKMQQKKWCTVCGRLKVRVVRLW
ncbi:hypothetical protein ACF1DY_35535 [Streptomyces albus]